MSASSAAIRLTRLANGLRVVTAEMPDRASVSLGLWLGVGGRHETAMENGVCHFIEHMVFKGTRRRSARGISQAVEGVGGYLNAFTGEESTCFYARSRHDRLEQLLDVLADMLQGSKFSEVDVERERNVIKEEVAMYLDQPQHHVQELLNEILWPDQPLGRPLTGTLASLDGLGRREMVGFKQRYFGAGATCLVAAGHVQHERLVRLARRYLGKWPEGTLQPAYPTVERQTRPEIRLHPKETEQAQLALGIRTCSRHDPRRHALRLLSTLLGENMSSRLFQVVREDLGLAYNIYSSLSGFDDTGTLVISAGLDPDNLHRVVRLVVDELRRLAARPPGGAEFGRARDYVLGQMDLGLENTENRMQWVGEQLMGFGRVITAETVRRRLGAVTPGEVRAVARDFIRPERLSLAVVSPLQEGRRLRGLLRW